MVDFKKSEAKEWARENQKGIECCVMPSFTPDLGKLDEDGIRHDVQHAVKQGWSSFLCAQEACGMTFEERKEFLEIACDEAGDKIHVAVYSGIDTIASDIEMLQHFEKAGGTFFLLGFPVTCYPNSEEDIYGIARKICNATNLAVNMYANPQLMPDVGRFQRGRMSPKLYSKIAEIDNVTGFKAGPTMDDTGWFTECYRLFGDKILIASPSFASWPLMMIHFHQQWAPALLYDVYQTPDNPRCAKMFNLFLQGDIDHAMELYEQLLPINQAASRVGTEFHGSGLHSYTLWKYFHWMSGGNGGMLRPPCYRIFQHHKDVIRAAWRTAGLKPRENEEEFIVGRLNYEKGARAPM